MSSAMAGTGMTTATAPENTTSTQTSATATEAESPSSSVAVACEQYPKSSKPPPEAAAAIATENAAAATTAASAAAVTDTAGTIPAAKAPSSSPANIEFEPPAACIRRLLKQALPKSTNVSRDSLAAISRASGIFVLYLTACANDVAREGRRSTIVAKDVLGALKELDFEDFVPLLEKFLQVHRREEQSKKDAKKATQAQAQAGMPEGAQEGKGGVAPVGDGVRDATTGKFVAKVRQQGEGERGVEEGEGEPATTVKSKHAREEEEGNHNTEEGGSDQSQAKKQKIDKEKAE